MATVTSKQRPVTVATWYLIEDDGQLMLCINADRARLKHIESIKKNAPDAPIVDVDE